MTTPQPLIGVTTRFGQAEHVRKNTKNYFDALARHGAIAVALSPDVPTILPDGTTFEPDASGRLPDEILDHLNGLVLAGGGDVDPKYFNQPLNGANVDGIDLKRDELELNLARAAMLRDLPTFAICRGCQVLNVAAGGSMIQHFDGHRSPRENPVLHDVQLSPESRVSRLIGDTCLPTNTYHHQGMDRETLASLFTPVGFAEADPWLVEAYESDEHRWLVGVQWHPERLFELPAAHGALWVDFVRACGGDKRMG